MLYKITDCDSGVFIPGSCWLSGCASRWLEYGRCFGSGRRRPLNGGSSSTVCLTLGTRLRLNSRVANLVFLLICCRLGLALELFLFSLVFCENDGSLLVNVVHVEVVVVVGLFFAGN